jgi:hypothetical protein
MATTYSFPFRRLVATPCALDQLSHEEVFSLVERQRSGDWGDLCEEDRIANEEALLDNSRILSSCRLSDHRRIWIITKPIARPQPFCCPRNTEMATSPYCKNCGHPAHKADCGVDDCGCVRYEARRNREDRRRTWVVRVAVFEVNKWMPESEVKVKAQGIGGAAMKAVRLVKHERESKRRILRTRITVVPVTRSAA